MDRALPPEKVASVPYAASRPRSCSRLPVPADVEQVAPPANGLIVGMHLPSRRSRSVADVAPKLVWAAWTRGGLQPPYDDLTNSRTRSISSIAPNCEPIRISSN